MINFSQEVFLSLLNLINVKEIFIEIFFFFHQI